MTLDFTLAVVLNQETQDQLNRIEQKLDQIIQKENQMTLDFGALTDMVGETRTVEDGIQVVLNRIADQLDDAAGDQAKIDLLTESLRTGHDQLAAAIVANTPADPGTGGGGGQPVPFVTKTQEDVDTPDADGSEPGSGAYEHYRERLFEYNANRPVVDQAPSDIDLAAWTALPVG